MTSYYFYPIHTILIYLSIHKSHFEIFSIISLIIYYSSTIHRFSISHIYSTSHSILFLIIIFSVSLFIYPVILFFHLINSVSCLKIITSILTHTVIYRFFLFLFIFFLDFIYSLFIPLILIHQRIYLTVFLLFIIIF
jgi:hypothetical protein